MYTLLYGANKNMGDFLIYERSKDLLRKHKNLEGYLEFHSVHESLDSHLHQVNKTKAVIICGGPGILHNVYPGKYPLATNLDDITIPIIIMGSGWYGVPGDEATIAQYHFSESTKGLFEKIQSQGYPIGVRDYLTERVLKNSGIDNVAMTGCPTWYDLEYLDLDFEKVGNIKRIVFTPPAKPLFTSQSLEIMHMIRRVFPKAYLICSFHRGILNDAHTTESESNRSKLIAKSAEAMGFEVVDSSYGVDKVNFYKKCDLHIGYRVHGHLYFLSQRKPSFLIHEDGRGRGTSEALGLSGVQGWNRTKLGRAATRFKSKRFPALLEKLKLDLIPRNEATEELEHLLERSFADKFANFQEVANTMRRQYPTMTKFIESIP